MIEILLIGALGWAVFAKSESPLSRVNNIVGKKTPQEHINFLIGYMRAQGLTPDQLKAAWDSLPAEATAPKPKRSTADIATKVMFFLGATLVFAGVGVYISMFWESMSSAMRIIVTLGVGMGLSVLSVSAMKEGKYKQAILPLIIIAAIIETGGWFVFLHEMFPRGDDWRKAALFCFGVMAFQQAMVFHKFRRDSLAFTAIVFAYGALQMVLDIAGMKDEHIALLLGGSLVFTAYTLSRTAHNALTAIFYFVGGLWFNTGVFAVLENATNASSAAIVTGISIFSLGNAMRHADEHKLAGLGFFFGSALFYAGLFDKVYHTPLELVYFGTAVALMYGAAIIQSRALLATSVLAMLGFIGYYTSEYFMNSVGWPVALIIMGIAFLGVGSMAIRVKRKYNM